MKTVLYFMQSRVMAERLRKPILKVETREKMSDLRCHLEVDAVNDHILPSRFR